MLFLRCLRFGLLGLSLFGLSTPAQANWFGGNITFTVVQESGTGSHGASENAATAHADTEGGVNEDGITEVKAKRWYYSNGATVGTTVQVSDDASAWVSVIAEDVDTSASSNAYAQAGPSYTRQLSKSVIGPNGSDGDNDDDSGLTTYYFGVGADWYVEMTLYADGHSHKFGTATASSATGAHVIFGEPQ